MTEQGHFPRPNRADRIAACREGTRHAALIGLLKGRRDDLGDARPCPGWRERSVKSARYWDVNHVKGHGVRTETSDDGTQRYHLVLPNGVAAPLGHVEPALVKIGSNRR